MSEENINEKNITWEVPEYNKPKRGKNWYTGVLIIASLMLVYSFFTANFLFALIIILSTVIVILFDSEEPIKVTISLSDEGIKVGKKFYDYDGFKNFAIVYKPQKEVKNLYLEFNNLLLPRLSIPLSDQNPLPIREKMLKYLSEDLERKEEPLSESLAKLFKL